MIIKCIDISQKEINTNCIHFKIVIFKKMHNHFFYLSYHITHHVFITSHQFRDKNLISFKYLIVEPNEPNNKIIVFLYCYYNFINNSRIYLIVSSKASILYRNFHLPT